MQRLQVLNYKRSEYPNLWLCAEIMLCISGSNSTVERAFSNLTVILSDRRVHMSHARMEMVLSISVNDKNWSPEERDEIIERATEIYLEKRRKKKLSTTAVHWEPPRKVPRNTFPDSDASDVSKCSSSISDDECDDDGVVTAVFLRI